MDLKRRLPQLLRFVRRFVILEPGLSSDGRAGAWTCAGAWTRVLRTLLVLAMVTSWVHAENLTPPLPDSYLSEVWNREHGLPQISVLALAQAADGYLWLGTEEGLVRFDGTDVIVHNRANTPELRSHYIKALHADEAGDLWVGTEDGLLRLRKGKARLFTEDDGLVHPFIQTLHEDAQGRLWIGTLGGVGLLEDGSFRSFTTEDGLPHDIVHSFADAEEGLWIGTEAGLAFLDAQGGIQGVEAALPELRVLALHHDPDGTLWIGTHQGLVRLDGERSTVYSTADGLADPRVNVLFRDQSGDLWVGTDGSGLHRFRGEEWTVLGREQGLPDGTIRAMMEDREGNLWVGTYLGGLVRLRLGMVSYFGVPEGLVNDIAWAVYQDRSQQIWISTNGGLTCLRRDGTSRSFTTAEGLPNNDVRSVAEDRRGRLWIGTTHGMARFDDTVSLDPQSLSAVSISPEIDQAIIRTVLEDSAGNLWITTLGAGAHRLSPSGELRSWTKEEGLPSNEIRAFLEDSAGVFWAGTGDGLARLDGERFETMSMPSLQEQIFALHEDQEGALWVGILDGAVARLKDGKLTSFGTVQGLPEQRIHSILTDAHSDLWLTGNDGIFHVTGETVSQVLLGQRTTVDVMALSESHGMRSGECNGMGSSPSLRSGDGRLWFACIGGAAVVSPAQSSRNEIVPAVHLQRVLVGDQRLDPDVPAELAPGTRDLEFHFASLSLRAPERNQYRYRLEGFDEDWVESHQRSVRYTNLDPGKYRFRVLASNDDGVWNEEGAEFNVTLKPAFYQTGLFLILSLVSAALGLRFLHGLRMQHVLRLKLKRHRIAMLETQISEMERFTYAVSHDLKSPLVTIRGFAGYAGKGLEKGKTEQVHKDLQKIDHAASKMQLMLDELLELSRSGRVIEEDQEVHFGQLAREVAELIEGRIHAAGATVVIAENLPIVHGDRKRLHQVLQNLIDNAVKFTGDQTAPRIEVGVRHKSGDAVLFVRDNGAGIPADQLAKVFETFHRLDSKVEGSGLGLALVQRVVEAHGGRIWAESQGPGFGSTFCFTLPGRRDRPDAF